jgi:outer membrane receptor protein involved in Fe transport
MRYLWLAACLIVSNVVVAQRYSIAGKVLDTLELPLPGATILLLNPTDSSLINFSASDNAGNFFLKNVAKGEHLLKITFVGYQPFSKKVMVDGIKDVISLEHIKMTPSREELDAVIVESDKAPVVVKKDTIEFNATYFKTQQNANVEDLLKKLPGVEVDNDGNITAQGEQVQNVTVDGKNFFGRDPKIATKNLPADAIDKVQIFDKKSDQAQFTGIDDGQREKTINLELKEEKRNGAFGTLTGGIGSDSRFMGKASINRFTRTKQLSFLGMANNINDQGFSIDDYLNFTGGSQRMMSGGGMRIQVNGNQSSVPLNLGNRANGQMTSLGGGINFNNEFTPNTDFMGSYFYNFLDHDLTKNTYRENFLPQGIYIYEETSRQESYNDNHRVNMTLEHEIDSANSLKFVSAFTYNQTNLSQYSLGQNRTEDGNVQNESERWTTSNGSSLNFNSNLLLRHRFDKKNRTLSADITFKALQSDRDGTLNSFNRYFTSGTEESNILQRNAQTIDNISYGATVSYTEPLGNRKYVEANYSYLTNQNNSHKDVYDISSGQEEFNTLLSNIYQSNYQYQRAGINFRLNRKSFSFTTGVSTQHTRLKGELELHDATIDKSFENILPSAHFNYDFTTSKHLRFDYETSMQEPTIQQLAPVIDNSDPLNITEGNPDLEPAYQHSWRVNYVSFDPGAFISFFTFFDVDYTTNAISTGRWINEDLITNTRPVNVDKALNLFANANVFIPINKLKSRFGIGGNWRDNHSIQLLNDVDNQIRQQTIGVNVRYDYTYKEIVDLGLSAQISNDRVRYEFDQPDQLYINQTYSAESSFSFLKNYRLFVDLEYLIYKNEGSDYRQEIPLINLSLSRFLLKNKSGELKFAVNNLLDKTLGISQTANVNYTERTTTNSLGRFFMVSFTYALNKQLNPMGFRRPRSGMRIIRP